MSNPIPSALALTTIADGSPRIAAPVRNNYTAIQTAVNELIAALSGGTVGQLLTAVDSTNVVWAAGGQKLAFVGNLDHSDYTDQAWFTANAAVLVPFTIQTGQTIDRIHLLWGSVKSGNYDIGVYDSTGTKVVTKGSTAQSTLSVTAINEITFASTALAAGLYYLALACDNTTGRVGFQGNAGTGITGGLSTQYQRQVATAFPLPASLTVGTTKPTRALLISAPLT